ncbi:hypothetical protein FisN_24Lh087 [Fistulifera solaris]|uniref:Protein kinase domain-containing protein n=1 Tax=Fistulifera solaris TaxID=1519565 RepID=A0A1Z5K9D8_FISSO|nr:hypothetical protein FisN_24Lh087 [Fistulifera solaris]|eukprot:GAX22806.1 hypothetical protein FisN_24Lh087 [Fistulifera solaris]
MTNLQPPTTASLDDRMFTKCKALEGTSAHSTVGFSTEDDYTIPSEQAEELVRKTEFRVSELLNQTTYLKRNHRLQNLPLFERSDFEIGDVVGLGGFSTICDISSFHNQHQLPVKGGRKYVVKSLTPRLAHETKKLTTGARDLVMEAYYVSALAHKNIIELRGCSAAGVSGFAETCRPDGFFLVYDKLTITLGQRINQWREESSKAPKSKGLLSIPKPACIGSPEMLVERLNAAIDVASALEYMHDKRILFRDLKPGR